MLEVETAAATLVFVRTKTGAADVAERLQARGYAAEAMHGDMTQAQREQTIRRLRASQVEIVVATDVAARGLDVEHMRVLTGMRRVKIRNRPVKLATPRADEARRARPRPRPPATRKRRSAA